jgi:hypothetical protein
MAHNENKYGGLAFLLIVVGTILFWPVTLLVMQFDLWFILILVWTPTMILIKVQTTGVFEYIALLTGHVLFCVVAAGIYLKYFFKS